MIEIIRNNPYQTPPSYEKLKGDLKGSYSRLINREHRLVYTVNEEKKTIRVLSICGPLTRGDDPELVTSMTLGD